LSLSLIIYAMLSDVKPHYLYLNVLLHQTSHQIHCQKTEMQADTDADIPVPIDSWKESFNHKMHDLSISNSSYCQRYRYSQSAWSGVSWSRDLTDRKVGHLKQGQRGHAAKLNLSTSTAIKIRRNARSLLRRMLKQMECGSRRRQKRHKKRKDRKAMPKRQHYEDSISSKEIVTMEPGSRLSKW